MKKTGIFSKLILVCALLSGTPTVFAQDEDIQASLRKLEILVAQQQQELEAQRKELSEQKHLIRQLQSSQSKQAGLTDNQVEQVVQHDEPRAPDEGSKPPAADIDSGQESDAETLAEASEDESTENFTNPTDQFYDPSNTIYDKNFPGAWQLPGTRAAMKIGGYVNLSVVDSFDPLLITDRFITGSIPVGESILDGAKAGTDVTANQTRINMEVREQTKGGQLRAFIEGDFEGDNTTFRLRHAFGQYRWALAGKTWSTLMDVDSRPEEVDFEGINGQILVRQSQVRVFPSFWQGMKFKLALENPRTDVINGIGAKGHSDFVISVDRLPLGSFGSWNSRVGFIIRDLQAQLDTGEMEMQGVEAPTSGTNGWGITTSGKKSIPRWGEEDFLLWQLSYGEGIGRYINDLGTVGGGDAVFDPAGKLRALPVFAGYVSYQHLWRKRLWFFKDLPGQFRSNFTASWVSINNFEFQDDSDYRSTLRASVNLMYQPAQNIRLGTELLWGKRTNKDKSDGTAAQIQISARYNF